MTDTEDPAARTGRAPRGPQAQTSGTSATSSRAFAVPSLPTPVTLPDLHPRAPDPPGGSDPAAAGATVRWCRKRDDDGPVGAPYGWRPTAGAVAALPVEPPTWLVGAGAGAPKDWRAAGAAAVRAVRGNGTEGGDSGGEGGDKAGNDQAGNHDVGHHDASHDASHDGDVAGRPVRLDPDRAEDVPDDEAGWAALAMGVVLGSHRFSMRSTPPGAPPAVTLPVPAEHRDTVERAVELAHATALARDLADTPSGTKSPDWFARTAVDLVTDTVVTTVRDEQWLEREGFGGVLAVGGGSSRPPRLLELSWTPPDAADSPHVVLVGKGITFDTGGISIKTNAGMADMRTDCSGGAAVVAALHAVARLSLPVRVTGLVPLAENHVSGSSYRPGDVVRHHGGTTSEVTNTDAEGRMVLADALVHAARTLAPDVVVDVATLTGAMKVALGVRTGGVFATTPALAEEIVAAGAATGEAWWPMPLTAHLEDDLDSRIADVRQAPPGPGGIVAALFLRRFTAGLSWAHLDIAGPARCDSPHEEVAKGATGFATRTLVEFCVARAR